MIPWVQAPVLRENKKVNIMFITISLSFKCLKLYCLFVCEREGRREHIQHSMCVEDRRQLCRVWSAPPPPHLHVGSRTECRGSSLSGKPRLLQLSSSFHSYYLSYYLSPTLQSPVSGVLTAPTRLSFGVTVGWSWFPCLCHQLRKGTSFLQ